MWAPAGFLTPKITKNADKKPPGREDRQGFSSWRFFLLGGSVFRPVRVSILPIGFWHTKQGFSCHELHELNEGKGANSCHS